MNLKIAIFVWMFLTTGCAYVLAAQPVPATLPTAASALMADGDQARTEHRYADAMTAYKAAAAIVPDNPEIQLKLAVVSDYMQDRDTGVNAIQNYVRLDPSKESVPRIIALQKAILSLPTKPAELLSVDESISLRSAELCVNEMDAALHEGREDDANNFAADAIKAINPLLCDLDLRERRVCMLFGKIALVTGAKNDVKLAYGLCYECLGGSPDDDELVTLLAQLLRHLEPQEIQAARQERADALRNYEGAKHGVSDLMLHLGDCFYNGSGVAQNYQQAMRWYRKAADGGNPQGMYNNGRLYEKGLGTKQDYSQAMTWYQRAADGGDSEAMLDIGNLYKNGSGIEQDYYQAETWYQRAAASGNSEAMLALGNLYENGNVGRDIEKAVNWYHKAVENGNEIARGCEDHARVSLRGDAHQEDVVSPSDAITLHARVSLRGDAHQVVDWGEFGYKVQIVEVNGSFDYLDLSPDEVSKPPLGQTTITDSAKQRLKHDWPNVNFEDGWR